MMNDMTSQLQGWSVIIRSTKTNYGYVLLPVKFDIHNLQNLRSYIELEFLNLLLDIKLQN